MFETLLELVLICAILIPLLIIVYFLVKLIVGLRSYIETVTVNRYGVNSNITANVLSDSEMINIGFMNSSVDDKQVWRFTKNLSNDVTFSVIIFRDSSDLDIQIIDESLLEPYDYINCKHTREGREVNKNINKWMNYLQYKQVITGYSEGDFIS